MRAQWLGAPYFINREPNVVKQWELRPSLSGFRQEIRYFCVSYFGSQVHQLIHCRSFKHLAGCETPRIVTTFSLFTSMKKLGQKENNVELRILNGMRVASIIIVIFGHRFGGTFSGPVVNRNYLEEVGITGRLYSNVHFNFSQEIYDSLLLVKKKIMSQKILCFEGMWCGVFLY